MFNKPRIFISAVSREFETVREIVAITLKALKYEIDYQPEFTTQNEKIREMLKRKIDASTAVFHIVGDAYGAEPPIPDDTFGRCSYTQFEAKYANSINKPIFYLVADDELPRDQTTKQIDRAKDNSPQAIADVKERRRRQAEYKRDILMRETIYYSIKNVEEAKKIVQNSQEIVNGLKKSRSIERYIYGTMIVLILTLFAYSIRSFSINPDNDSLAKPMVSKSPPPRNDKKTIVSQPETSRKHSGNPPTTPSPRITVPRQITTVLPEDMTPKASPKEPDLPAPRVPKPDHPSPRIPKTISPEVLVKEKIFSYSKETTAGGIVYISPHFEVKPGDTLVISNNTNTIGIELSPVKQVKGRYQFTMPINTSQLKMRFTLFHNNVPYKMKGEIKVHK